MEKIALRKDLASLVFTGCVLAATPLVAAPSATEGEAEAPAIVVHRVQSSPVPDQAAMVLVGTALIGLAAVVRRAA